MESIKLINEIIIPYVQSQRKELGKPKQAALVIMDVFRGQITDDVISLLRDNNIHYVLVPNNMTQLFQPLDLTVNKHCKSYLKRLFSEWYAQQIENQLSLGKKVEEIKIEFRLTTLKPLHAKWLVQPGVVACTCNLATLEAKFRNGVGSSPVKGNSPSIGGWTV